MTSTKPLLPYTILPSIKSDTAQILEITKYYVRNTTIIFLINDPDIDYIQSRWEDITSRGLPYLVAVANTNPESDPSRSQHDSPAPTHTGDDNNRHDDAITLSSTTPPPPKKTSQRLILGFAHAAPFNGTKLGYAPSVDFTLYVHPAHVSRGVGGALLSRLLADLRTTRYRASESGSEQTLQSPVRNVYGITSQDVAGRNGWVAKGDRTIEWYKAKFGFREVGRLNGVGEKFGLRIDVTYLEKQLDE